jgi:hypothetical protein
MRLTRGDTAGALEGLLALPDTACERCATIQVARGLLLEGARRDAEAESVLAGDPPGFVYPTDGLWLLARGRVAERRGDRMAAMMAFRCVRDMWLRGDPSLAPHVAEATTALARLGP